MRKEFLNGDYAEKEMVLTIRVPKDFDHDDERMLDDEIANLLFKQGWELVDSKEYRNAGYDLSHEPEFAVDHLLKFIEREVPFRMKEVHGLDVDPGTMNALIEQLKDHNDVMFDYDALDEWLLDKHEELTREPDINDPALDENGVPLADKVWICVYRDALGYGDDYDNITYILVPTDWLMEQLRKEGEPIQGWFDEYTADSTDSIARNALYEGKILNCSHEGIKAALLQQPAWISELPEMDRYCVMHYSFLLCRPLQSKEEYKEIDGQVNEMILEWASPEGFFEAYPDLKKYAASSETKAHFEGLDVEELIGSKVEYLGYFCEVVSVDYKTVFLQNVNNDQHFELSYSAFMEQAMPIISDDEKYPLQNYDDAVSHLREVLNARDDEMDLDDVRTPIEPEDFIPIFKSTNYFGIYCYHSGENEYYLVNRNTGEHKMVLGDSFEFVGKNLLDCMKDEEILNVANKEWLHYLVDFSLNNVKDIVPLYELQGIANLQTALRNENIKTSGGFGGYYPKPSLADQIASATQRQSEPATDSVMSVAHFAESPEVKDAVLQSDALRKQVQDICQNIPGYASMPSEDKNRMYDLVKKSVSLSQQKASEITPER